MIGWIIYGKNEDDLECYHSLNKRVLGLVRRSNMYKTNVAIKVSNSTSRGIFLKPLMCGLDCKNYLRQYVTYSSCS